MRNNYFLNVTSNIYIRRYELNPRLVNGLQVFVYAECTPNVYCESEEEGYYLLDLYFSVDGNPTRDHIVGVPFGAKGMDKQHMDAEMDQWATILTNDESFFLQVKEYMRKENWWEETLNEEYLDGADDSK